MSPFLTRTCQNVHIWQSTFENVQGYLNKNILDSLNTLISSWYYLYETHTEDEYT